MYVCIFYSKRKRIIIIIIIIIRCFAIKTQSFSKALGVFGNFNVIVQHRRGAWNRNTINPFYFLTSFKKMKNERIVKAAVARRRFGRDAYADRVTRAYGSRRQASVFPFRVPVTRPGYHGRDGKSRPFSPRGAGTDRIEQHKNKCTKNGRRSVVGFRNVVRRQTQVSTTIPVFMWSRTAFGWF